MQIIEKFKNNYGHMFDFFDHYSYGGKEFLLHAKFNQRNTKYFATKKVEIYSFSNNEYLFIDDSYTVFNQQALEEMDAFIRKNMEDFVQPNDEHMSSVISMIYMCDDIDENVKKNVKKFKLHKSFKFGLNGWVNVKLIVLLKDKNIAFENKLAKGDALRLTLIEDK